MLEIHLYEPHDAQQTMHNSVARFRVAACGRRFGKTHMAVNEVVRFANLNKFTTTTWVAPTFRQARLAFTIMINNFGHAFDKYTKNPLEIKWLNGSQTKFLSTEAKDRLRGDSSDLMVIDEAAMIDGEIWTHILRPMLSDTKGKAIIISTPKSLNWFHELYARGQDPMYKDYESFKFPTSANPYIEASEIEEVRSSLPADVFKQEYLAEFLEGSGTVFRNIKGCICREDCNDFDEVVIPGHHYTIGLDLAKQHDFTCIIVVDNETKRVVNFERFNRVEYQAQIKMVEEVAKRYNNARIVVDSTGVGDPILEQIKTLGLRAEGYHFTNTSKQQLIEHLAVQLEKRNICYPEIQVLINELMAYQYTISRSGKTIYGAPSGLHDDCVIALALAVWGLYHQRNPRVIAL